jgi:quaternary ammonium compound-resistance protein SugE
MNNAWLYLIIAGLLEIGWPLGLKLSQLTEYKVTFIFLSTLSMILSGLLLWLAQREIPMGTAYAIWTGIGASGTFLVGILAFREPADVMRIISFTLILTGLVGLKMAE